MRKQFLGYYPPNEEELSQLWGEGLIVLDTNALLNLFRYTPSTREDFVGVLNLVQARLWIPYQVGHEFHRRRLDVIDQQVRAFDEIEESLEGAKNGVATALNKFRRHPSLNVSGISEKLEQHLLEIAETVAASRAEHSTAAVEGHGNDQTFEEITVLFDGRVGGRPTPEALSQIYAEGATRYASKVPPGYKDQDKPEPDKFGDLVLWKQILEKGKAEPRPAIFVTDDSKEDWWYKVNGKTHGPRVELVDEYFAATGFRIHFYSPERFLAFALERSNTAIKQDFLSEVEAVSHQRTSARAAEQLLLRRNQLLRDRDRLLRQLHATMDDRHGAPPSIQRSINEGRNTIERLHMQQSTILTEIENISAALDSDQFTGRERDELAMQIGRLQHERATLESAIDDAVQRNEQNLRFLGRRSDPERISSMRTQVATLEEQLEDVELALQELGD